MHIQTYIVDCDSFNADPQRYMVDAEGNYRMDSVGWGVCVSEEPDLSGKAYWVLKDYLANGYGFLAGHDTMYAYPGAYYDAFGADLDESTIDPNDGTTWYYDINSWLPGTVGYTRDGRQSNTRGGHFYMNQLMGSNKGNVYSNTTTPSDSVSMLLSTGGSHGKYEKNIMFGGEELQVEQFGYEFRAVFSSPSFGQWNTYEYWLQGAVASGTETPGSVHKPVIKPDFTGELTVQLWPAYAQQGADQTVYAGTKATFSSYGYALDDGTAITAEWQYSTDAFDPYNGGAYLEWHDVKGSTEWGGLEVITVNAPQQEYKAGIVSALSEVNPSANTDVFHKNAKFHGIQTFLTVDKVDIAQHGTHFRVKYTAISSHGTKMEWYSNIADEKSGAWTTDTGMFGGDVSQSIKNNSNILNVKRPELEIITTPSALCGGAPYIDTMTPDEYGQMLLLSNAAATMANGTATYEAILYYKPGDLVPTPTWQYMTYTDHAPKFWADSTGNKWTGSKAQQLGVNVTVTNTDLGDALYQGQPGYKAIKSVMTISNVPASMYNPETLTKYYFRCIGVTTYTTVKDTYSMARVDKWGGLVIDYAIDLHHNGVVNYGNTNIINGATVTDAAGIVQATTGRQSSVWTYPKLSIHVPAGHHIKVMAFLYLVPEAPSM